MFSSYFQCSLKPVAGFYLYFIRFVVSILKASPVSSSLLPLYCRPDNLPWLYYSNNARSLLENTDIPTKFSLKADAIDNLLRIYVSSQLSLIRGLTLTETSVANSYFPCTPFLFTLAC